MNWVEDADLNASSGLPSTRFKHSLSFALQWDGTTVNCAPTSFQSSRHLVVIGMQVTNDDDG